MDATIEAEIQFDRLAYWNTNESCSTYFTP